MSMFDSFRRRQAVPQETGNEDHSAYPSLKNFFGAYLNQDFDLFGHTPDEVTAAYRDENTSFAARRLADEIRRFMADHGTETEEEFHASFYESFQPDMSFEDWKQQTAREFLLRQLAILEGERNLPKRGE